MSAYLKLGSRLLVLCVLALAVVLLQVKPANACTTSCRIQCRSALNDCTAFCGTDCSNCTTQYNDCLTSCGC